MTTLTITVKLDNAAFADNTGTELARILTAYADRIRYDAPTPSDLPVVFLRDVNGTTVGALAIEPDEDDDQDDDEDGCEGHESLRGDSMGVTVYCDGTCR